MQDILDEVDIDGNEGVNGFLTTSTTHDGTHTKEFITDLHEALVEAKGDEGAVLKVLDKFRDSAQAGDYLKYTKVGS